MRYLLEIWPVCLVIDCNQVAYTNAVISLCYEYEYPYDVIMTKFDYSLQFTNSHGREVYVFVRRYQQTIDELKVNVLCEVFS